jgi:hypothetical protein
MYEDQGPDQLNSEIKESTEIINSIKKETKPEAS